MDVQTETAEMKTDDSGVRLCYCFASPLVRQEGRDLFPVDLLNYMDEICEIKRALEDSGRDVSMITKKGTRENLLDLIDKRPNILHFTCHGEATWLALESEDGRLTRLEISKLEELCRIRSMNEIDIVFVSACHSELVGKAFVAAGVKHVIAVEQSQAVMDKVARKFTRIFYRSLLQGVHVYNAFQGAVWEFERECGPKSKLFLLLPQIPEVHDTNPLLPRMRPGPFSDLTKATQTSCRAYVDNFIGRQVEVFEVYRAINRTRLVLVTGPIGIGKTQVALRTADYASLRNCFDVITEVSLESGSAPLVQRDEVIPLFADILGDALGLASITPYPSSTTTSSIERWLLTTMKRVKTPTSSYKILLVLDGCHSIQHEPWFIGLLTSLLESYRDLHILISTTFPIDTPRVSIPSEKISIKGLSATHTASLFVRLCPTLRKSELGIATLTNATQQLSQFNCLVATEGNPTLVQYLVKSWDRTDLKKQDNELAAIIDAEKKRMKSLGGRLMFTMAQKGTMGQAPTAAPPLISSRSGSMMPSQTEFPPRPVLEHSGNSDPGPASKASYNMAHPEYFSQDSSLSDTAKHELKEDRVTPIASMEARSTAMEIRQSLTIQSPPAEAKEEAASGAAPGPGYGRVLNALFPGFPVASSPMEAPSPDTLPQSPLATPSLARMPSALDITPESRAPKELHCQDWSVPWSYALKELEKGSAASETITFVTWMRLLNGILRNFSPRLLMWEDAQVIARHEKLSPLHPHASVPLKHLGWGQVSQETFQRAWDRHHGWAYMWIAAVANWPEWRMKPSPIWGFLPSTQIPQIFMGRPVGAYFFRLSNSFPTLLVCCVNQYPNPPGNFLIRPMYPGYAWADRPTEVYPSLKDIVKSIPGCSELIPYPWG